MSQLITLSVSKCTESTKGGYIITWRNLVQTALGTMYPAKGTGVSYCTKSATPIDLGTTATVDLDRWEVRESEPFIGDDGLQHTTKWLAPKA